MEDVKTKAKKAVLEEIMSMMDSSMSDGLKSKSPKFMAAEIEVEPATEEIEEEAPELDMEAAEGEMSDDDRMRLKELYEKYC